MSAEAAAPGLIASPPRATLADAFKRHWPLVIGFLLMAVPTVIRLAEQVWPLEIGAHGPIVLATGAWLLFHVRGDLVAKASKPWLPGVAMLFAIAVPLYTFGRSYDLLALEAGGLYLFFIASAALILGFRPLRSEIFPFLYLAFLIPIPGWVLELLTMPLQHFVSWVSTAGLTALGYPIAREGVIIFIAQYQLLVEDACSGMNSLIGLSAVMLFYIYIIHRASMLYAGALALAILPIAVFANLVRVVALILLTYYYGDQVAQGFMHVTTGVVLFAFALGLTILLDTVLRRALDSRRARKQETALA